MVKTKNHKLFVLFLVIAFGLIASVREGVTQQVIRGPYLQIGTPTSIVVKWRTDIDTDSRVVYGASPNDLNLVRSNSSVSTEHEIQLPDLQPDTRYFYAVGTSSQTLAGGDSTYFFLTAPVTGTKKPTRIWVLGDSGTKNRRARAVRDAYYEYTDDRHTDLWLMLGDNAYSDGEDDEYQAAVFDMYPEMLKKSVLWATRGNHDKGPRDASGEWTDGGTYYNIFSFPTSGQAGGMASGTEAYYSFDYANVHFICLESTSGDLRDSDSPMWTWLEEDLAAHSQDWTIAFWHHPPYSKGSHDSDDEGRLIEMRENALPILESWGVDLVLTGHSHSYERSFLLDGHYGDSSTLTAAMKIDDGDGRVDGDGAYVKATLGSAPHEGAVYVVAGSSGKTDGGPLNHPIMITSLEVLGSVVLDIDDNQLDAAFIDDDGQIRDYFTLVKGEEWSGETVRLQRHSGDGQSAEINTALPDPLVVRVRDGQNQPVAGVAVTFEIIRGDATLSDTEPQISDEEGLAAVTLDLGSTPGPVEVQAQADSVSSSVTFTAIAVVPSKEVIAVPRMSTSRTPGDADDPAIWIHPSDPARSVIIGTDKQSGIFVWDLSGNELQQIPQGSSINNVDVRQNVPLGGQVVDIVAANMRDAGKLAVFTVNPNYSGSDVLNQIADVNSSNNDIQEESYGICLYKRKSDGALFVIERPKSKGEVRQYRLSGVASSGGIVLTPVRDLNYDGGTAEGFVADDDLGFLYITEEEEGIHKYFADPSASTEAVSFFATDDGIESDREGLALYACDDSTGYLVLSSQGNSTIKLYERQGTNEFVGTIVPLDEEGETGLGTDGLDVTSFGVSSNFPRGFLVVHDQSGHKFHLYDWQAIANSSLNLCVREPQEPAKPRFKAEPTSFDFGSVLVDSSSTQSFVIKNTGEAKLEILAVTFVGADAAEFTFEGQDREFAIPVGDSASARIRFEPVSEGEKTATLRIESNDAETTPHELILSGTAIRDLPVSVRPGPSPRPDRIVLKPSYPNPFNAETIVEYGLPETTQVKLVVYNLVGQPIRDLVSEVEQAGFKRILWNGKDNKGMDASSGTYYLQLNAGGVRIIRSVTLLR